MRTQAPLVAILLVTALAAQAPEALHELSSPLELRLAELQRDNIPVGGVILWWGNADNLPDGFELCDGTVPLAKDAVLKIRKPDLRDRFAKGPRDGAAYRPETAVAGGSHPIATAVTGAHVLTPNEIPAHSHPIPHRHDLAAHTHPLAAHDHPIGAHVHPIGDLVATDLPAGTTHQVLTQGTQVSSQPPAGGLTGSGGGGATQPGGPATTAGPLPTQSSNNTTTASGHTHTLSAGDHRPPFLEMLFIIRVK